MQVQYIKRPLEFGLLLDAKTIIVFKPCLIFKPSLASHDALLSLRTAVISSVGLHHTGPPLYQESELRKAFTRQKYTD